MSQPAIVLPFAFCACIALLALAAPPAKHPPASRPAVPAVLGFTMKDIDGNDVDLARYAGKVLLIVNTASECGYTPQYKDLQALHDKYGEQGLVVLGFPSNDFKEQEPGTDADIKAFCEKNYAVTFPLFSKVSVKGVDQTQLYRFLTGGETNPKFAGEIKWNFTKFLVARDGTIVNRFEPKVSPSADEVTKAIEAELKKRSS